MKSKSILFLSLVLCLKGFSQVKISGPECIVPGAEYQYNFYGAGANDTSINICLDGGYFSQDKSICYNGTVLSNLHITWNDNIVTGKISMISASGNNTTFTVRQTINLQGGKTDSLSKIQLVNVSTTPKPITCTTARGGNCSPFYVYHWEQSNDDVIWKEVSNATSQNLQFTGPQEHTVFLRRRVNEMVSNSINYSDVATIVVTNLP